MYISIKKKKEEEEITHAHYSLLGLWTQAMCSVS